MRNPIWNRNLCLLLLLVLLLAGCQPASTQTPSLSPVPTTPSPTDIPPTTVVLTIWHSWDTAEEGLIRGLLTDYQAEHPGVLVRLRRIAADQVVSQYEEAVLAGEGPDLLAGRSDWIGGLAERRAIASLDTLLEQEYWDSFYPFTLEGVRTAGHRYAVPYAGETVALYYNRDFVADPPTTTTSLLNLAATWPGPEQAGLAFPFSFYNTIGYLYAFGGRLLDDQGRPVLDTLETRAWLAWLQEVRESPGVIAADSYGQADALFKAGSLAMVVSGSWVLSDYVRALGGERLGVAPLPMLDQTGAWPTPYVGYRVLMVNPVPLVEHPQATLELLRFLGGPAVQQLLAGQLDMIPTWSQIDLANAPLLAGFVCQVELGRPRPVTSPEQAFWEPIETLLYNVTTRRVPVDTALGETQQQVEQILGRVTGGAP